MESSKPNNKKYNSKIVKATKEKDIEE